MLAKTSLLMSTSARHFIKTVNELMSQNLVPRTKKLVFGILWGFLYAANVFIFILVNLRWTLLCSRIKAKIIVYGCIFLPFTHQMTSYGLFHLF